MLPTTNETATTAGEIQKTSDLPRYRIRNSADVLALFQKKLDLFPRVSINGEEHIQFAEFNAYLFRPEDEHLNQLTHLIFPQGLLFIPNADVSLREHSATSFPQVSFLADAETDELYIEVASYRVNEEIHTERYSLILGMDEVFLISDLWDAILLEDRPTLEARGFQIGMSTREWAKQINKAYSEIEPIMHIKNDPENDVTVMLRKLPLLVFRRGAVGTNGSLHCMPEYLSYLMENNRFIYEEVNIPENPDDILYEVGDVHIHSLVNEMSELQREVSRLLGPNGPDIVRRNPSVPDIFHQRATQSMFNRITSTYGNKREINAMKTFGGVIVVDAFGIARGARWLDLYQVDLDKIEYLNDRARDSILSNHPDPKILAEQYEYIDSVTTEDFGTDDMSPHVGDPNYDSA